MKKPTRSLSPSWSMWLQGGIAAAILILSLCFLLRTATEVDWQQTVLLIRGSAPRRILSALALTGMNYLLATGYDFITASQMRLHIGRLRLAVISLISFAFNNNLGLGAVTGTLMRYRFFSRLRISTVMIGQYMILFSWVYWLGLIVLATVIFLFWDPGRSLTLPIRGMNLQTTWIGIFSLLVLILFSGLVVYKRRCRRPSPVLYPIGTPRVAVAQVLVSSLDWLLLSSVFYLLLGPHAPRYLDYLPVFLLAQLTAVMSHAPAGAGAFDSVVIYYLKPVLGLNAVVSSLLLFRLIYFLLPFVGGTVLWGLYELISRRRSQAVAPLRATGTGRRGETSGLQSRRAAGIKMSSF